VCSARCAARRCLLGVVLITTNYLRTAQTYDETCYGPTHLDYLM
jgi:hypothetical protein